MNFYYLTECVEREGGERRREKEKRYESRSG